MKRGFLNSCVSAGSAKPHGAEGWAYLGLEGAAGLWGNHKSSSLAPSFADLSSQGEGSIPCFSGPLSTTAKWGMTQAHSRGFRFQNPESQQDKHWALSLKSLGPESVEGVRVQMCSQTLGSAQGSHLEAPCHSRDSVGRRIVCKMASKGRE